MIVMAMVMKKPVHHQAIRRNDFDIDVDVDIDSIIIVTEITIR